MTRQERLNYCRVCRHSVMTYKGLICGFTNEKADFDTTCPIYQLDEEKAIKIQKKILTKLDSKAKRSFPSTPLGIFLGILIGIPVFLFLFQIPIFFLYIVEVIKDLF